MEQGKVRIGCSTPKDYIPKTIQECRLAYESQSKRDWSTGKTID